MTVFIHDITGIDHLKAFSAVKDKPYSLLLDSADQNHPNNRYSFVLCHPIETIETHHGVTLVKNKNEQLSFTDDPFAVLQSRIKFWTPDTRTIPDTLPFQGGAAGLFTYDLGRYLETLPTIAEKNNNIPDMAVGIYDQVLAHDHAQNKTFLITHAQDKKEANKKRNHLIEIFSNGTEPRPYTSHKLNWQSNFDKKSYMAQIRKTIDHIYEGDIFQANIAQRFDATLPKKFDPFAHYLHMRDVNPAPFMTYMNIGNTQISSASPERFLTVHNGEIETRPIKGTRPHVSDTAQDQTYKHALCNSEKDRAENTMIVDLLRNDLSKVCTAESVRVTDLCKLETFASVHHLVSTIHGTLHKDKTSIDLLRACFPGGSITGAPKIRAMEIIEELEPTRRGPYCGSIGYIGFNGNMDTNILIRTLVYDENSKVSLQAGGGIVADSDPISEYQETIDKTSAILESF